MQRPLPRRTGFLAETGFPHFKAVGLTRTFQKRMHDKIALPCSWRLCNLGWPQGIAKPLFRSRQRCIRPDRRICAHATVLQDGRLHRVKPRIRRGEERNHLPNHRIRVRICHVLYVRPDRNDRSVSFQPNWSGASHHRPYTPFPKPIQQDRSRLGRRSR